MCIEEASREYARVTMPITENHKNGMGVAHGGAIFSLADVAFGCAANAGNEHGVVSLSTTIEYLRPGMVSPLKACLLYTSRWRRRRPPAQSGGPR